MRGLLLTFLLASASGSAFAAEPLMRAGTMTATGYDEFMFLGWGSACSVAVSYFSYPPIGDGMSGIPTYWAVGTHTIEPGTVDVITKWAEKGSSSKAYNKHEIRQATEELLKAGYGPAGHHEKIRPAPVARRPGLYELIHSTIAFKLSYRTDWPAPNYKLSEIYYSPLSNCALVIFRDEYNYQSSYRWKLIRLLNPGVRRKRARAHVTNGLILYKEDMDLYGAEAELAIAADMDPQYPLGLYYHAQLLATHGRYDEALKRLAAAVKLKPEYKKKAWEAVEFESLKRDLRFQKIVEKKPFFP